MARWVNENRSTILSWAVPIGAALIFLWIGRGTPYHQLAIGISASLVTLLVALALFEVIWRVGILMLVFFGVEIDA